MGVYKRGRPHKFNPTEQDICLVPDVPGEYRICDAVGNRKYIGETCNIRRRMKEHMRTGRKIDIKKGDYFEYKIASEDSTSEERRVHERQKIAQHKPELNLSKGGEGRVYTKTLVKEEKVEMQQSWFKLLGNKVRNRLRRLQS